MKNEQIKLLIMDIDGTLVNDQKQITEKTKKALMELQKHGVKLALASGRPAKGLIKMADQLNMNEYGGILISSNGAKAETMDGEVLFENQSHWNSPIKFWNI